MCTSLSYRKDVRDLIVLYISFYHFVYPIKDFRYLIPVNLKIILSKGTIFQAIHYIS